MAQERTIWLHAAAPAKPPAGEACNGCGLCCAAEPCPLGLLLTGRRRGACRALVWDEAQALYRCGVATGQHLGWLPRRLARRWIAAGAGCDSTLGPA